MAEQLCQVTKPLKRLPPSGEDDGRIVADGDGHVAVSDDGIHSSSHLPLDPFPASPPHRWINVAVSHLRFLVAPSSELR